MRILVRRIWERREEWLPFTLLCLLVLALFARSLSYEFFVFDDAAHIRDNPRLHPLTFYSLGWIWGVSMMPVPYTLWGLIGAIFGTSNPLPFRVLNLLLHSLNASLLLIWIRKILPLLAEASGIKLKPESVSVAAFLGGVLFVLHPVHVEAVVWISSAKELLGTTFGLLSFLCFLETRSGKPRFQKNWVLGYVFLLLACFSQLGAAALIGVFLWLDLALFRRPWRDALREYGGVGVLGVLALWLYYRLVPTDGIAYIPKLGWRVVFSSHVIAFYLSKLLFWFDYHFDYGLNPITITKAFMDNPMGNYLLAGVASVFLMFVMLMYFVRPLRAVHFAIGIVLILLIPFTGVLPFIHQNISTAADRYLYFPSIGYCLAMALAYAAVPRKRIAISAAVLFLAFLATLTIQQVPRWRTSVSYLAYSVQKSPLSIVSRSGLVTALRSEGRLDEATQELRRMLELDMASDIPFYKLQLHR